MFPALVIQNLWVCTIASLQECAARNELHRLLHQCMCGWLCVFCLRNSESAGVLSSLARRNVERRLLQQCMCGGLCVSCLGNPKSVGVLSSLAGRKVQHRLLHQLCVGLCVSHLRNPTPVVCKAASLEEKYSIGCCTSCVWGYVFPAFVIQHLWCAKQPRSKKCTV